MANEPTTYEFSSVWDVARETSPSQRARRYVPESMSHPAKMLPAIAREAILRFTVPGDVVVDPMCGIGTTLVEAMHFDRDSFGVEYEKRWAALANANVSLATAQGAGGAASVACGDGRDIAKLLPAHQHGRVSLVITSPPYGKSLHGNINATDNGIEKYDSKYSKDRANLGNRSTGHLLDAFGEILEGCEKILRPGGHVVITTRPWREGGLLVDLPGMVTRLGREVGFSVPRRDVALLCRLSDDEIVGRASFFQRDYVMKQRAKGVSLSVIAHEDVIILRKSGAAGAANEEAR